MGHIKHIKDKQDECEKIATSRLLHRDLYDWEKSLVEYYQRFGVPAELILDEALRLSYRVTVDWVDSMLNGKTLTIEEKTIIKSLLNKLHNSPTTTTLSWMTRTRQRIMPLLKPLRAVMCKFAAWSHAMA